MRIRLSGSLFSSALEIRVTAHAGYRGDEYPKVYTCGNETRSIKKVTARYSVYFDDTRRTARYFMGIDDLDRPVVIWNEGIRWYLWRTGV